MYNILDQSASELARIDEQLRDVSILASDSADPVSASVAEVLGEAKLEQYFQLCELVDREPSITQIYARALQRVEVIEFLVDRANPEQYSAPAAEVLGRLSTDHAVEKQNLEAFFELFAPKHPVFETYRKPSEAVQDEVAVATTGIEDQLGEPELGEDKGTQTPEKVKRKPSAEQVSKKLLVNGNCVELTEFDAQVLIIASEKQPHKEKLKAGDFTGNEELKRIVLEIAGREITPAAKSLRVKAAIERFKVLFPGMFTDGGVKNGAWIKFNMDYSVEIPDPEAELLEDAQPKPEEASDPEETAKDNLPEGTTDAESSAVSRRRHSREKSGSFRQKKMTPGTRLLPDGYMIDRKLTPYSEIEKAALAIINDVERKEPYSPMRIADELRSQGIAVNSTEVNDCLKGLSEKLPQGWLIKVPTGKTRPDGWRLGSGIRIVTQRGGK